MIMGLAGITLGVADLDEAKRFISDFGLPLRRSDGMHLLYELEECSTVTVKKHDDPSLPAPFGEAAASLREIVWAIDSQEALEALEADLRHDVEVKKDEDGSIHFVDPSGIATRLRLFLRKPVLYCPDQLNAPDAVRRLGRHRRWHKHCRPKVMQHVVFCVDDALAAARFYVHRLGFNLSDALGQGIGYFLRAPGTSEHHSIFFMQKGSVPSATAVCPLHVAFGVEDIDEMMVGANHMDGKGWKKAMGPGRHRIASALFYYLKTPFGVEFEYGTDNDHLDEHWRPMLWEQRFGFLTWLSDPPPFLRAAPEWNVTYVPQNHPIYQPWDASDKD
jgi:catechol 2,3-dioxygenase-like lactoylglutathione lyase family enzyme